MSAPDLRFLHGNPSRYYLHGDPLDGGYYCQACDLAQPAEHFAACAADGIARVFCGRPLSNRGRRAWMAKLAQERRYTFEPNDPGALTFEDEPLVMRALRRPRWERP